MSSGISIRVSAALAAILLQAGAPPHGDLLTFKAKGLLDAQIEQPGPAGGRPRVLLSYTYDAHGMDVVALDPADGVARVLDEPATGEYGGKSMVRLKDGAVIVGTYPRGHLLELKPGADALTDLGRPCPKDGECWIWDLAQGSDGKIYGATSPQSKLIRFDPATGRMEDLGRMDPVNGFGRFVQATRDGFVYMATGYQHPQVVAYRIATGEHRLLLPELPSTSSVPSLYRDQSGRLFLRTSRTYLLSGFTAVEQVLPPAPAPEAAKRVDLFSRFIAPQAGKQALEAREVPYAGKPRPIFRLTAGADGQLYCSSVLPDYYFRIDPRDGRMAQLGLLGFGEVYQMIPWKDRILMAAYSAFGGYQLLNHAPGRPFAFEYDPQASAWKTPKPAQNPSGFAIPPMPPNWRPEAMTLGPGGDAYVGGLPGYGQAGAVLYRWNPATQSARRFEVDPGLSIASLCDCGSLLAVGLSTETGTGGTTQAKEAKLVLWRPDPGEAVYATVPVPGAAKINNLVLAPGGKLYGIAGASQVFSFDIRTRTVQLLGKLPISGVVYSSAGLGPDGSIYGLATEGVYRINPKTGQCGLYAPSVVPITAGLAILGGRIYYASGPTVSWVKLGEP